MLTGVVAEGRSPLVVDLTAVDFLDSTGLGVLVKALKRIREHDGRLAVVATSERIAKIFRITGLAKVFAIHGSADSAVASV